MPRIKSHRPRAKGKVATAYRSRWGGWPIIAHYFTEWSTPQSIASQFVELDCYDGMIVTATDLAMLNPPWYRRRERHLWNHASRLIINTLRIQRDIEQRRITAKDPSMTLKGYTDYPIFELGDVPGETATVREVTILAYDGNKYCTVRVGGDGTRGVIETIKAGYLFTEPGRWGEVPCFDVDVLNELPLTYADTSAATTAVTQ